MKVKFMKYDTLSAIKTNIRNYASCYKNPNPDWVKSVLNTNNDFGELKKVFPDFQLIVSDNPEKDDFENMKIIYLNMKELSDSQASDERLWAGLCHTIFWEYMQKRWPISPIKKEREKEKYIINHYFLKNNTRYLLVNGISRLWWYARLTYDENNLNNQFELTEYLAKDINGKGFVLFGSNFSNNRELLRTFLYTIKKFEEDNLITLTREEFNTVRKKVVIMSGKILIDSYSLESFENKITKELIDIYKKRNNN